jgi:hypothetical protein
MTGSSKPLRRQGAFLPPDFLPYSITFSSFFILEAVLKIRFPDFRSAKISGAFFAVLRKTGPSAFIFALLLTMVR